MLKSDYGFAVAVRLTPGERLDLTKGILRSACAAERVQEREHTVTAIPSEVRRRAGCGRRNSYAGR